MGIHIQSGTTLPRSSTIVPRARGASGPVYHMYHINYWEYKVIIQNSDFHKETFPQILNARMTPEKAFELYKQEGDVIFSQLEFLVKDQDVEYLKIALSNFKMLSSVQLLPTGVRLTPSWGAVSSPPLEGPAIVTRPGCSLGVPNEDRRLRVFLLAAALAGNPLIRKLVVEDTEGTFWGTTLVSLYSEAMIRYAASGIDLCLSLCKIRHLFTSHILISLTGLNEKQIHP